MFQRRAYVWFREGPFQTYNSIWAKSFRTAVDAFEETTQNPLPLLIKGVILEVNQHKVVIAQKEDPMHFKMGAFVSEAQKAGALIKGHRPLRPGLGPQGKTQGGDGGPLQHVLEGGGELRH